VYWEGMAILCLWWRNWHRTLLSANDDGQSFSESMEVLKKYAHGVT
jgi:hypothetical protein